MKVQHTAAAIDRSLQTGRPLQHVAAEIVAYVSMTAWPSAAATVQMPQAGQVQSSFEAGQFSRTCKAKTVRRLSPEWGPLSLPRLSGLVPSLAGGAVLEAHRSAGQATHAVGVRQSHRCDSIMELQ
jgi:hypothetical protein